MVFHKPSCLPFVGVLDGLCVCMYVCVYVCLYVYVCVFIYLVGRSASESGGPRVRGCVF